MVIAKTASRNVAFKVARMRESIMEDQDGFIMRKSDVKEAGSDVTDKTTLEDIGYITQTFISPIKRTIRKIRRAGAAQSLGYCLTVEFCKILTSR